MEILKLLKKSAIVRDFLVVDYKSWNKGYFLRLRVELINDSLLFTKEYYNGDRRYYSFHWQKKNGDLIVRWDNSPHHKQISSFPHHKHIGGKIYWSREISLPDVLRYIELRLKEHS